MAWSFVLADLSTGTALGEVLDAKDRSFTPQLNRMPTAGFTIRLDHQLSPLLLNADVLLKVYQDQSLRFVGPVISVEEAAQGQGGTLKANAAGAFWRLTKRLIGKSATGYSFGTVGAQVDRGLIAADILATVNADGDTGIRLGTIDPSALGYVGPWRYMAAADAITQLSATLDGYDFEVAPVEPTADGSGLQIGTFNAAGLIGVEQPEAIFEYGTGRRNMLGYTRPVTLDGLLNAAYNLPEGFPDNPVAAVITQTDYDSIVKWGRMEGLVAGDVTVDAMRQKLVDEHIRIRRNPRQVITFDPARNAPHFGTDYMIGDIVEARAVSAGTTRFDGLFRIYGVTITIDQEGAVTEKPDLIPYG